MDQVLPSGAVVTPVHFTYPVGNGWRIACMPNMTEFHQTMYHPNYQRSNDTRAVTCQSCLKSSILKESVGTLRV